MFHQMPGVSAEEFKSGHCREFAGNGTPHLRVPGLVGDPTAVRVDMIDLPLRLKMSFPDNHLNGQTVHSDMQILRMETDSDGTPVLLRSMISNDGVWQKGHKVFVWGEWENAAEAPAPTVIPVVPAGNQTSAPTTDTKPVDLKPVQPAPAFDPAEKLAKTPIPQLLALAKEIGLDVEDGAAKKDIIVRILAKKAELDKAELDAENKTPEGAE